MKSVKINLPILVQQITIDNVKQYYLKPLFLPHPVVTHRRYERAVAKFQTEIRHAFQSFKASQSNVQTLLWMRFFPDLTYKTYPLEFTVGKTYVKGGFGAAHFMLKGKCYVCLPAFNHYIFMASPNEKGKYDIPAAVEQVIQRFLRAERKESGSVDAGVYMSKKGEFIAQIDFFLNVKEDKFAFEEDPFAFFFSSLGGQQEFIGEVEIYKVGHDLNERYPIELRRAFYREEEVERVSNIIYQKENSPIILVGREGVGKKSILEEAVWRYYDTLKTEVKNTYTLEKIWQIDPTRIIAGMSVVGMWQKRFEAILNHVFKRRKNFKFKAGYTDKVLIDNVIAMLRIGKSSQNDMTLSDVLKPYLEKRMIQLILIATPEEWKVLQDKDRRFADLFQVIRIEEPTLEVAAKMVFKQRNLLELEHGCQIGVPAMAQLFTIHRNYLKSHALPGGVINILRQLAVKYKFMPVDVNEVREEFEELSGLYKEIFDDNYLLENEEVRQRIGAQLVGQPDAVDSLVDIVHLIKAKLNTVNKPLGSFIFIGPTGVGKTQAAKVLCNYLLGNEDYLMRFDMNEYIDGNAVERLIGDYNNPEGLLTGKVRYRPFGIVLFDEIEKAHPNIHDLLLQVLDDGRLTDSLGRTVDFSNTIIIMTSNVGAREADMVVGFGSNPSNEGEIYRASMENKFRPEFINRIDKVVIFKSLQRAHILKIARLQINELLRRDGFVRRTTILNIAPKALEWVAHRGFDEKMGGRALKRQIERDLTSLSAEQLIKTHSDRPIIFEILFKNNQLSPNVIPLDFIQPYKADWIPKLPNEKKGRKFYGNLLRIIERIEKTLTSFERENGYEEEEKVYSFGASNAGDDYEDAYDDDWLYFDFKNKLAEIKSVIRETILGFQNKFYISPPVIALRLKRVGDFVAKKDWAGSKHRNVMMDKLFQQEGMDEIKESYSFNAAEFDRVSSQFLGHFLDVTFLKLYMQGVIAEEIDLVKISFHSYIEGLGKDQINYLIETYQKIFKGLDIACDFDEQTNELTLEGYNIYVLFKGEHGIHLFYIAHQNPLPIRVSIVLEDQVSNDNILNVIRVYNGTSTITDLRTNFTNAGNISINEFKMLLYGGLEEGVRNELNRSFEGF